MSRLLFIIAIAALVYLLLKSYRKGEARRPGQPVTEDMVRCTKCGVHLPRSESIMTGGNYFCCAEHRDTYRK